MIDDQAYDESARRRGVVWSPAEFSRGHVIAALPEDLEPRMIEPGAPAPFAGDEAGVLLLEGPIDDAAPVDLARRAMVPVVVLADAGPAAPPVRGVIALTMPVSSLTVASVLRAACEQARVRREARETTRQLEELNAIGVRLSAERDTKLLLDLILTKARTVTRATRAPST